MKVYPLMKPSLMEGRNKEVAGIAAKVLRAMKREVEERGLEMSVTEGGKKSKSLRHAAVWKRSFRKAAKERESCNQCGNTGSRLNDENEAVGSTEKEEVRCEVFRCHEDSRLSEEVRKDWYEEAVEGGHEW